ncbi:MAG: DNA/RNA non-specific endonuclease [Chitinophagaceae bacterium]|nr:MAG: DNA/RNA non-specific endonuclease [Chitinophagaceae bacterium]
MRFIILALLAITCTNTQGQTVNEKLQLATAQLVSIDQQRQQLFEKIESLKLDKIQESLEEIGLPALQAGDELVKHAALTLAYATKFEQARWVAHIIIPDVMKGTIFRTNDFRVDEKVKSGSATEADYFLKKMKPDSSFEYDGFGYDRGHLAPSADFRWSRIALSESYYYSNMSPQLADFNRGAWGDLEDAIRGYMYSNPSTDLYVVTGPVLREGLPVIERSVHKVSIPEQYFKVVMDLKNKKAIAFLMPNKAITQPLRSFATSINEIEKLTGLDFFNKVPTAIQEQMESLQDPTAWLPAASASDVEPLAQEKLERNHFNTTTAAQWVGQNQEVFVCGTVVGARLSRAGNVLINLDKQFPNQAFTVFVKKEDIVNFNYDLTEVLKNKVICVKGKVMNQGGTPTMYISNQNALSLQ